MCLDRLLTSRECIRVYKQLPDLIPVWKIMRRYEKGAPIESACNDTPAKGWTAGIHMARFSGLMTVSEEPYRSGFHCCLSEWDCRKWAISLHPWEWLRQGFIRKTDIMHIGCQGGVTVVVAKQIEYKDEVLYR